MSVVMSNEKSLVEEGIAKIFIWRHVYTIGDVIEFTQRFTPEIANLDTNVVRAALQDLATKELVRTASISDSQGSQHMIAWNPKAQLPAADSLNKTSLKRRSLEISARTPKRVHVLGKGLLNSAPRGGEAATSRNGNPCGEAQTRIRLAQSKLHQEKESLRKLQLLKTYKENNEKSRLEELVEKWREASQEAAAELLKHAPDGCTMTQLLRATNVDFELIRYNEEDECFD